MQTETALPSDKYEKTEAEAPESPPIPAAAPELIAALDLGLTHLLLDPTHWRVPVPEPLDAWMPVHYALLDGGGDKEIQAARNRIATAPAMMRVYPGPTPKERLLVVRITETTYVRIEVLPWTMGK